MHLFDYSFLSTIGIPVDLFNQVLFLSELKTMTKVRKEKYPKIFEALEPIARIQSIKGSNAIENIIVSDKVLYELVKEERKPQTYSEQEIAGYRDALDFIHQNYNTFNFNEKTILDLHRMLYQHTDGLEGGHFKTTDNVIVERNHYGHQRVRFTPVTVQETPKAMEQLLLAYQAVKGETSINKYLLIPCFILDFLCIHPFEDGNGRMSRLLSLVLMYQAGLDVGKYISFEAEINKTKGAYYEALRLSSLSWHENKNDFMPFIKNFIGTLYMCYKELDNRFAVINNKKINKEGRIEATLLNSLLPMSIQELCLQLPDISLTTIQRVVGKMVKEGKIEKIGTNRSAKYLRK